MTNLGLSRPKRSFPAAAQSKDGSSPLSDVITVPYTNSQDDLVLAKCTKVIAKFLWPERNQYSPTSPPG